MVTISVFYCIVKLLPRHHNNSITLCNFQSEGSYPCPASPPGSNGAAAPKEITLAKISLAIAIVFIVSHSVKWIPNFYELVYVSALITFRILTLKVTFDLHVIIMLAN